MGREGTRDLGGPFLVSPRGEGSVAPTAPALPLRLGAWPRLVGEPSASSPRPLRWVNNRITFLVQSGGLLTPVFALHILLLALQGSLEERRRCLPPSRPPPAVEAASPCALHASPIPALSPSPFFRLHPLPGPHPRTASRSSFSPALPPDGGSLRPRSPGGGLPSGLAVPWPSPASRRAPAWHRRAEQTGNTRPLLILARAAR